MPRVVFRCDASNAIGSGHVARCMALAHALRARGAEVELVARGLPKRVAELLVTSAGVKLHELPTPAGPLSGADEGPQLDHAHWLPVPQNVDARQTAELLRLGPEVDWLIVDHYALDVRWERTIGEHARRTLVIDDLADRDHACDALLDQNFFLSPDERYRAHVPVDADLMLGPRYALLREEFARERASRGPHGGRLRRVFVCFGGFDGARQTLRALEALEQAALDLAVDVVITTGHADAAAIGSLCSRHPGWTVHYDVSGVAALMAHADLAIGASGIMNWERAALCLPAIVASVAENQHTVAKDLALDRACIYLGFADAWTAETLSGLLRGLAGTPSLLQALSQRAAALTDGAGARRVAARLLPETVRLRAATAADCDAVHAWRNDEETRRRSLDTRVIPLSEHRRWFERVLADDDVALLIGEQAGRPVGVLRYDVSADEATVSIYLVPGESGRGLGSALLRAGSDWLREQRPHIRRLHAHIRANNGPSRQAFSNAGFRLEHETFTLRLRHDRDL